VIPTTSVGVGAELDHARQDAAVPPRSRSAVGCSTLTMGASCPERGKGSTADGTRAPPCEPRPTHGTLTHATASLHQWHISDLARTHSSPAETEPRNGHHRDAVHTRPGPCHQRHVPGRQRGRSVRAAHVQHGAARHGVVGFTAVNVGDVRIERKRMMTCADARPSVVARGGVEPPTFRFSLRTTRLGGSRRWTGQCPFAPRQWRNGHRQVHRGMLPSTCERGTMSLRRIKWTYSSPRLLGFLSVFDISGSRVTNAATITQYLRLIEDQLSARWGRQVVDDLRRLSLRQLRELVVPGRDFTFLPNDDDEGERPVPRPHSGGVPTPRQPILPPEATPPPRPQLSGGGGWDEDDASGRQ